MKVRLRSFTFRASGTRAAIPAVAIGAAMQLLLACSDSSSPGSETAGSSASDAGNPGNIGGAEGIAGSVSSAGAATAGRGANDGTAAGESSTTGGDTGSAGGGQAVGGASGASGASGFGPTGGMGGARPTTFVEDDGAECSVASLPDSASLTDIPKLPDPFTKLDGKRLATKADWLCRRQELKKQLEKYVWGTKPAKPETVTGTVSSTSITVKVTNQGKSTTFTAGVVKHGSGTGARPAIVVFGGASFPPPLDSGVINSEGVAYINYDPYVVGKEGTPRTNKQGAFYDIYGSNSSTGLLVAWAWGVSRIIDVIAQSDGTVLEANALGVTGCSRFGKGAFVTGVFDERIALTIPIEPGTAGLPILRGVPLEKAQSLSSAYSEQPWFGDAFSAFINSPTKLPIDTHDGVAMIAPRGLLILDNPSIAHLGPKSSSVAALAGAEVYKALGAGDNITYYSDVQNGSHCSIRPEWVQPLKSNIEKHLLKTGNDPGVMKISPRAEGKLSEWADWTTPTLN